ncbi:MAG: glycosyltransferase family 4 protein, partial [Myxococcota bacterium]|nr:glycosyltransferase family 4 protein [Myxococcota bacterium]
MHTLATVVEPGTLGDAEGQLLVGRTVANSGFLRAVLEHGTFERYLFFIGEVRAQRAIEALIGTLSPEVQKRAELRNMLQLPQSLASGDISVFHQNSPINQIGEIIRLRDRFASQTVVVTGQIHSLSYPSMMLEYIKTQLMGPSVCDAVFCSSTAGRGALKASYEQVAKGLQSMGAQVEEPVWELPVVPLGIDVPSLECGSRSEARAQLGIDQEAFVVLSIARFTEYDKMDLFPLLKAFAAFRDRHRGSKRSPVLVLAGARQGTKTPEMVSIWAKALQIEDSVLLRVDFADGEKSILLAAADCFVAVSDNPQETFGLSVVEAMAAGLPVIASDLDGYKDTVSEEVGIRVPTHWNADMSFLSEIGPLLYERPLHLFLGQGIEVDLVALGEAFETFYSDPEGLEARGRAASERARNLYDWPKVIAQ